MKKIKFTGKLSLNKETISKLNDEQMEQVNGGTGSGCTGTRYCPPPPTDTCDPRNTSGVVTCVC